MRCPECGAIHEAKSTVVHMDGELVEFGSRKNGSPTAPTFGEKVRFYAELRWYGRDRGYADGWAKHKYREKLAPGRTAMRWGRLSRQA